MERQLAESLRLEHRPVAIAFLEAPPPGIAKFTGTEPSGCSFWRLAAGGRTFYTVPSDHYNCAVGAYTHNVPLPPERARELEQVLGFMTSVGYIRMEEISGIHRLPKTPAAVLYALGNGDARSMTRQLFGAMVFLTSLFGVSAMPAVAQIERITITVDGMT
jgi:hypothetical protein